MMLGLGACASNRAAVYVANPCDAARYVRFNYAATVPGGDVDQLTGRLEAHSIKKIGTLGTENLEDSHLEAFSDSLFSREAGQMSYESPPNLQKFGDEEVYWVSVPAEGC